MIAAGRFRGPAMLLAASGMLAAPTRVGPISPLLPPGGRDFFPQIQPIQGQSLTHVGQPLSPIPPDLWKKVPSPYRKPPRPDRPDETGSASATSDVSSPDPVAKTMY